jgi:hypothetical protein
MDPFADSRILGSEETGPLLLVSNGTAYVGHYVVDLN